MYLYSPYKEVPPSPPRIVRNKSKLCKTPTTRQKLIKQDCNCGQIFRPCWARQNGVENLMTPARMPAQRNREMFILNKFLSCRCFTKFIFYYSFCLHSSRLYSVPFPFHLCSFFMDAPKVVVVVNLVRIMMLLCCNT